MIFLSCMDCCNITLNHENEVVLNLLILAAGQGSRLGHLAFDKPKSLVTISGGKPYLLYQMEAFAQFKFNKKIVVGGYCFETLSETIENISPHEYCILNNKQYTKGNLYSLLTAKNDLERGFYMFNADHYYSRKTYDFIFSQNIETITIFCDRDRQLTDDDMKVRVKSSGEFIEMSKKLTEYSWGYVGITAVPTTLLPVYWQACEEAQELYGDQANVESVVNVLAKHNVQIHIADISGSWWTEIDTPEDHQKACEIILKAQEKN